MTLLAQPVMDLILIVTVVDTKVQTTDLHSELLKNQMKVL